MYDPNSQLVFRALAVKERRLDDALVEQRLNRALALRHKLFQGSDTTGDGGQRGTSPCVLLCAPAYLARILPGDAAPSDSLCVMCEERDDDAQPTCTT